MVPFHPAYAADFVPLVMDLLRKGVSGDPGVLYLTEGVSFGAMGFDFGIKFLIFDELSFFILQRKMEKNIIHDVICLAKLSITLAHVCFDVIACLPTLFSLHNPKEKSLMVLNQMILQAN